jgi:uncharacterized delta-60 repeat protein
VLCAFFTVFLTTISRSRARIRSRPNLWNAYKNMKTPSFIPSTAQLTIASLGNLKGVSPLRRTSMRSLIPDTHVAAFTSSARATFKATRKAALLLISVAALLAGGAATARGQAALDGFDPNANGAIQVVVEQPDGKILIGGTFTTVSPNGGAAVTRNRIARLNPDGTLDMAFNPNADDDVYSIAVQADGKILVGGIFNGANSIGGQTRNFIARLDATTGLADSFNPNANGEVFSIAVQADGKILAGGQFSHYVGTPTIGGQTRDFIARLDATTGLADSFNPNAIGVVWVVAVQADHKILVGGGFNNGIVRLNQDGTRDTDFNPNVTGPEFFSGVLAIAVQADGKILAGGDFTGVGGQGRNRIARLDPTTGSPDSFDPNVSGLSFPISVNSIALQADGKILAGGNFTTIGIQTRNRIARLDAITGLADSFNPNANDRVRAIAVQADGKILVGGFFTSIGGQPRNYIARFGAGPVLIGLEVTQGVQDLNNSVTLVEHKKTFVRAHVKSLSADPISTSASLTAKDTTTGAILATIPDSNMGREFTIPQNPHRPYLNDSFLFEVPYVCRRGTVEFSFAGNELPFACETGVLGDECSKVIVHFEPVDPLSIKFLQLTYSDTAGHPHTPTDTDIERVKTEFLAAYPIRLVDSVVGAKATTLNPCLGIPAFTSLLIELNDLRNSDCRRGTCKDFYQGLLADKSGCVPTTNLNGLGYLSGHASAAFVITDGGVTRIHEQGHVLGLKHTNFTGDEECHIGLIPFPCTTLEGDGTLSFSKAHYDPDTVFGFDVYASRPQKIYEAITADFMSYGRPRWPSRVNYELLFEKFAAASPAANFKFNQRDVFANQTVIIDGIIQLNGPAGQIGSVIVNTSSATISLPSPGDYSIRLENSQGTELARFSFNPFQVSEDLSTGSISLLLPWDPNAKRIVLLHNQDVLDTRQASGNSPTVNVTFPNGGEVLVGPSTTFTWTAADLDGEALTYTLEYSTDNGTTWETLAINWNSESYPVDLTRLAGSNQALIHVTASDGFNCAQAQSQGTFIVPKHAPTASIDSPEDNRLYVADQLIILEGTGLDIEEGALDASRLTWTSNLNGPLGTGTSLAISALTLQEGTHTITLTATDSTAQAGSASISIKIFRTRPALPATLSVAPAQMTFRLVTGQIESRTLGIRNDGDGDLDWSAGVDQPWIHLGSASGATPYNLDITADATGLAISEYNGHVTIAAPGAIDSPQVVTVNLLVQPDPIATVIAVSRKTHGSAGDFDVDLPLTGTPGIECRTGGATNDHQMIVTFMNSVNISGNPQAQVTSGSAAVGSAGVGNGGVVNVSGSTVTIPLTNVANAQTINVTLFGVNGSNNVVIPMSVLRGDTNGDGSVNPSDVSLTKSKSGQTVNASNFREDVTVNAAINSSDVSAVKSKLGTALP